MKFNERLFFIIVAALVILVRLRYIDAALERDEGEYAYAGLQLLRGGLPYSDFYNMKLPGVYFSYSLIIYLLGASVSAIRWVLIGINLISSFFIFKIAQERFNGGWLAAATFLLMSLSYEAQGFVANSEHFVVMFFVASLFFINRKGLINTFISGILLGLSFLMKQHALVFVLIMALSLFNQYFEKRQFKPFLTSLFLFVIGYCTPLSIWGFWAYQKGILEKAYFLTFEYAAAYSSLSTPSLKYISNFTPIFLDNIGFWLLFFTTLYYILNSKKYAENRLNARYWAMGFGISFLAVCPGWHFRPHYFQLIFPFASLLIAYGWSYFKYDISFKNFRLSNFKLLITCLLLSIIVQFKYFFLFSPEELMKGLYPNEFFNETKSLSSILKSEIQPTHKIGMYGNEPQLWFYTQTQAASGFMYAYPLVETQPFAQKMTDLYIHETEKSQPEWLIYSYISKGESNKKTLAQLETWFKGFSREYAMKGVLYQKSDNTGEIEWETTTLDTAKTPLMIVYKRIGNGANLQHKM